METRSGWFRSIVSNQNSFSMLGRGVYRPRALPVPRTELLSQQLRGIRHPTVCALRSTTFAFYFNDSLTPRNGYLNGPFGVRLSLKAAPSQSPDRPGNSTMFSCVCSFSSIIIASFLSQLETYSRRY